MNKHNARHARVIEMREVEKRTWRQIGAEFGVGVERSRQIYAQAKRIDDPDRPFYGLSTRSANILGYRLYWLGRREEVDGILCYKDLTREDVRKAYEVGILRANSCRGMGKKTFKEIAAWAGFELPPRPKKKVKLCPHCGKELP
jgi:Sigma-70, region 4